MPSVAYPNPESKERAREEKEEMEFGKIDSCWDIKIVSPTIPYVGVSSLDVYKWATKPANMSREYRNGHTVASSKFKDGPMLIEDVMREVDTMFIHDFPEYNNEYLKPGGFREYYRARLEDPGVLYHVIFFGASDDHDAISFEWHAFHKHNDVCRAFIAGKSFDLMGAEQEVDKSSAWHLMTSVEGAIVGERKILCGEKPKGIDLVLNYDIENESLRHLRMLRWPLFNQHRETFINTQDAFECVERTVHELCLDGRSVGEIYSIDHVEIVSAGIWGATNVRAYIKKGTVKNSVH